MGQRPNAPAPDLGARLAEIQGVRQACQSGDMPRMQELLQGHPDVLDTPDNDERFTYPGSELWSPLHVAAMNGHRRLVSCLLDMGANPVPYEVAGQYHDDTYANWTDELRHRGHAATADTIEAAVSSRYGPPLDDANVHAAVVQDDVDRVAALLHAKPERAWQVNVVGNAPLHLAAVTGSVEIARLLIEHGAPIDAVNGDLRTPAVIALYGLHRYWRNDAKPPLLDLLLAEGAEYTMLIAASVGDERRVQEILRVDAGAGNAADSCRRRPLSGAVANRHAKVVHLLLAHGADPNAKEAVCQGGYSLRHAAAAGDADIVQALLHHGAVPQHWVDSSGDAMFGAYHGGHDAIAHMLYAHGGTMELQVYAAKHRIDVIAEVLALDPSKADSVLPYGWDDGGSEELALNIMRLAIRHGARFEDASEWNLRWTLTTYPRVYRLLVDHGARPEGSLLGIAGDQGRRYAGETDQLRHIVFLVEEMGADVDCADDEGLTPLARASREGHTVIVEYLLGRGADPNAPAPDWAKPIALAENAARHDTVAMLRATMAP
jgi:ankyrin repeat protein